MTIPAKRHQALFDALPREATLASRVVHQMETMIAQGGLADGSKLPPERDLADQFGVSRTVIREAVAALSARGLLEVQAGSGTVIKRPQTESIAGLISLSLAIGSQLSEAEQRENVREAARSIAGEVGSLAADRRTEDDLETLTKAARRQMSANGAAGASAVGSNSAMPAGGDANPEDEPSFLMAVGQAAHNPALALLLNSAIHLCDGVDRARAERQARFALDAIRKADGKAARRLLRDMFLEPEPLIAPKPTSKKDRKLRPTT